MKVAELKKELEWCEDDYEVVMEGETLSSDEPVLIVEQVPECKIVRLRGGPVL